SSSDTELNLTITASWRVRTRQLSLVRPCLIRSTEITASGLTFNARAAITAGKRWMGCDTPVGPPDIGARSSGRAPITIRLCNGCCGLDAQLPAPLCITTHDQDYVQRE